MAGEEKTKRINIAYEFLTSPSKRGDVQSSPRASATSEHLRHHGSSNRPGSTNKEATRSNKSRSGTVYKRDTPLKANETSVVQVRPLKETVSQYPQPDFRKWEAQFTKHLISGSKAEKGLKKWIAHEKAQRTSDIAFKVNNCKSLGVEPDLKGYDKPDDAHADVTRSLWIFSAPNVEERTRAAKVDTQFLEQMEKLKDSVDTYAKRIERRGMKLTTQDRIFHVSLNDVFERCIQLSSSIHTASILVKRVNIYPLDIADCCTELVWILEEKHGLSQKECHDLIRCALIAHGCTPEQASRFNEEFVDRGTIRAKKEALVKRVLDSANVFSAVIRKG